VAATLNPTFILLDAGATYRLVRLACKDRITEPLRQALKSRSMVAFDWLTCPWCVSVWIAAGVVALTYTQARWWLYAALGLTLSAVAGIVSELVP
jgi:hypothetical protein